MRIPKIHKTIFFLKVTILLKKTKWPSKLTLPFKKKKIVIVISVQSARDTASWTYRKFKNRNNSMLNYSIYLFISVMNKFIELLRTSMQE